MENLGGGLRKKMGFAATKGVPGMPSPSSVVGSRGFVYGKSLGTFKALNWTRPLHVASGWKWGTWRHVEAVRQLMQGLLGEGAAGQQGMHL